MRIERGGSGGLAATLRDVRMTAGALTAAVTVGDQEWRLVMDADEIGALHTAIHEWFKIRQSGIPGPGRSER
jgi:chlorite dismutase